MAGFYRLPTTDDDLAQGDIFSAIPRVEMTYKPTLAFIRSESGDRAIQIDPCNLTDETTVLADVQMTPAIVISQSCDAARNRSRPGAIAYAAAAEIVWLGGSREGAGRLAKAASMAAIR